MDHLMLPVRRDFTPKTYDIDFAGHVSNISYIRWLEDLRLAWLDEHDPLQDQLARGVAPTLLRTEINYRRQIQLFDRPVVGELGVVEMGRLKFVLGARFTVKGELRADARQTGIWFELATGKPVRPDAGIIERFKQEQA